MNNRNVLVTLFNFQWKRINIFLCTSLSCINIIICIHILFVLPRAGNHLSIHSYLLSGLTRSILSIRARGLEAIPQSGWWNFGKYSGISGNKCWKTYNCVVNDIWLASIYYTCSMFLGVRFMSIHYWFRLRLGAEHMARHHLKQSWPSSATHINYKWH